MIRMFDVDKSGTLNFEQFCSLWGFLSAWRGLFDRFDTDRSGYISLGEFKDALVAFGYRVSPQFVDYYFKAFDPTRSGRMAFDRFVHSCINLKSMTDSFKKWDDDRDGYVTLSFEEYMTGKSNI
jgi:peflin